MSEVLSFDHYSPSPEGPTLSMSLAAGQILGIAGAAGSGKSRLLRNIAGLERSGQGTVHVGGSISAAVEELPRRVKLQAVAKSAARSTKVGSDALVALGLSQARLKSVSDLTPGQEVAARLIDPLASPSAVALIDGLLDLLDPWRLEHVLRFMRSCHDRAFVVTSNRPDLLERFDLLIVLSSGRVSFAGTPGELVRSTSSSSLTIFTDDQAGVRALVEPFEASVSVSDGHLAIQAKSGQELAASLLLEGYGDVRTVVLRPPTLGEALLALQ
jgi:ABC-type sulfate/molybdate transport systems ATPase subunit